MPNTLGKIIADFSTTLSLKVAIGDTSATLSSATDDDGVALPTGTYFLTVDGNSASKEYIMCTLTSTALTSIQNISRQGTTTSGFIRTHRKGATVAITDFATLKKMLDLLDGTTAIEGAVFTDITFSGTTTGGLKVKSLTTAQRNAITPANGQIVYDSTLGENYQYIAGAWSAVSSGSTQPNASATVAGKVEIATSAQSIAGTDTGETGALNSVLPSDIAKNAQSGTFVYGADAGGDDTYVVALTPSLTAYTTGQTLSAKMTTANTGACTIDFGPGVKSVKLIDGTDPLDGDIASGKIQSYVYDGTNLILQNPAVTPASKAYVNTQITASTSSYVSALTTVTATTTTNTDTTITCGFTPKAITVYYNVSGFSGGAGRLSQGIAIYNSAGTLVVNQAIFTNKAGATTVTTSFPTFDTTAPYAGDASGTYIIPTLSVNSVSSTGLVLRTAFTQSGGPTGTANFVVVVTK